MSRGSPPASAPATARPTLPPTATSTTRTHAVRSLVHIHPLPSLHHSDARPRPRVPPARRCPYKLIGFSSTAMEFVRTRRDLPTAARDTIPARAPKVKLPTPAVGVARRG